MHGDPKLRQVSAAMTGPSQQVGWETETAPEPVAESTGLTPRVRRGLSVIWLWVPLAVAWLATTWTPFDLVFIVLAAIAYLWVRLERRTRPVVVTPRAWRVVLWTALVGIGFDILVSRLHAVDPGAATAAQVGGALALVAVWLLVRVRALRSAIAAVVLFSIIVGALFIARVDRPGPPADTRSG